MAGEPNMGKRCVLAGSWLDHSGRLAPPFRCQWFFSWTELGKGRIAGFMAGYEGGGAFVEEPFIARFSKAKLLEFIWHSCDHISGEERPDIQFWPDDEIMECCDSHAEIFQQWHNHEEWENGYLCLAPGLEHTEGLLLEPEVLVSGPQYLFLTPEDDAAMDKIAMLISHTGIATRFR